MKYISIFLIAFLIISCNSNNKNNNSENNTTSVEAIDDYSTKIDSIIATTSPRIFNGVILITKGGERKYMKENGFANFEEKTPISIKDKFRIMSNSKQITATLVLKEVEKGNINLQSPISEYLKGFDNDWSDEVNIHQLLNMSSGIIGVEKPLLFEAGKGYKYSNPGYGLLGRIITSVTGKKYSQCANEMFKELGMEDTYCYEMNQANEGLVNGYDLKDENLTLIEFDNIVDNEKEWRDFVPAGGIISTANDLNIWDSKLHNDKILSKQYHQLMTGPSNRGPHAAFDNDTLGYAYGIRVHDKHPVMHLGHGGRGMGFVSIKFYIPEKDVDVIIWENIYCRDRNVMAGDIVYHFENEIRKIVINSNLVK